VPELPEVETIRRDLAPELEGRRIAAVRIHKPDIVLPPDDPRTFRARLTGRRIRAVERRAKYLILRLDDDQVVQVQLRMSGRFHLGPAAPDPTEFTHVAAELELDDGRTLYYDDVRRLGGFRRLAAAAWDDESAGLGPEPLEAGFTARHLGHILGRTRAPVKNALMNQGRVAGIGNIYASEALHRARVHPARPACGLSSSEVARLHRAVRRVLREALASAGTTFQSYRAVNGRSGSFQTRLRVYDREGRPCPRCGAPIERIVQAGRSTYLCPACQA